jgi:hypothetical protein
MFNSQVVKDRSGQFYIICLRNNGLLTQALKPEKFINAQASLHFVSRLQTPFGFWQSIAASNTLLNLQRFQNSHPSLSIEHYAAQLLVQGAVAVYKTLAPSDVNKNRSKSRFKDDAGRTLQLQPASSLLLSHGADKRTFHNEREAAQLIETLALPPKALAELHSTLNLAPTTQVGNSKALKSDIVNALVSGEVVITIQHEHKPQNVTEYIEEVGRVLANDNPPPREEKPTPFKLVLEDQFGEAFSNTSYKLITPDETIEGKTNRAGLIEQDLDPKVEEVMVEFYPDENDPDYVYSMEVKVGGLTLVDDETPIDSIGLQQRMANLGIFAGHVDGDIGPKSQMAIKIMQQLNGIPANGTLDDDTKNKLEKIEKA